MMITEAAMEMTKRMEKTMKLVGCKRCTLFLSEYLKEDTYA